MTSSLREAAVAAADVLERAVAAGEVPGAAFAVGHVDEGAVHLGTWGTADVAAGRAVTPDTPFCLASTTKPIATTVLGSLCEQGLVQLDSAITDLVPEFLPSLVASGTPTVRQVATHTAGLGAHHRFFYADERPPVDVLQAVRTLARPALPVGGQWRYSNLGYGVLEVLMERAAGATMAELVERVVFRPLGMQRSAWGGAQGPDGAATRYLTPAEPYAGYVTDHPPASEAWCSIGDLLAFGLAHARADLLTPATHALLTQPWAPRQTDGAAYALGWVTREYAGVRVLVHAGRMGGVAAHLTVVPALGVVVAALANVETDRLAEAVGSVLRATVAQYSPPAPAPAWTVGAAHPLLVGRWEGLVQMADESVRARIDTAGERITMEVDGVVTEVVMPHFQPEAVLAHVRLGLPFSLAPEATICHVDAVPMTIVDGAPVSTEPGERPDVILGGLVAAQYPGPDRRRQGDAVTAAMLLHRVS